MVSNLNDVRWLFASLGLPFSWRKELGKEAILRPAPGAPLGERVAIIIPDVHLGVHNDIFRYDDYTRAPRLLRFLQVVAQVRNRIGASSFTAVQLGDWYDFWRVTPGDTDGQARQEIENQYAAIYQAARSIPLRHCIGNHDAAFYRNPPPPDEIDVAVARIIGDDILCFHGHDLVTLRDVVVNAPASQAGLRIFNSFNSLPLVGPLGAAIQRIIDNTVADPYLTQDKTSLPWPAAVSGLSDWSAPWVAREEAAQLGEVIASFEELTDRYFRLAIVGHTHRPGVSWAGVEAGRAVPVVDAGSWTYGRAEFAVVCPDGVGLAALD